MENHHRQPVLAIGIAGTTDIPYPAKAVIRLRRPAREGRTIISTQVEPLRQDRLLTHARTGNTVDAT